MNRAKRVFDLTMTLVGLSLALPLMAVIAAVVAAGDGFPVLFRQERIGRGGAPFAILKFRTMIRNAQACGIPLTVGGDPRITRVGRWLRRTKLDELPQLFNVLRGEMSLVGPRPEVLRYVALYTDDQRRVLALRPGITDPASIAFRNESTVLACYSDPEEAYLKTIMPEKIRINLAYAQRRSTAADLGILLRTLLLLWNHEAGRRRSHS